MKILSKQNFNQNESKNFVVDNLSSAPSNPVLGQIYYNIQEERAYICIKAGEIPEWADLTLEEEVFVGKDEPDGRDIKLWIDPEDMGSITGYESMPLGSIVPYAGTTPPEGFLICDGAEIDRETYKELFKIIGTTYGSGDNSTTFNVPNIKGKTVVGLDSDDTDFNTLSKTGGSKYLQAHSHDIKTGFDYIASSGSKTSNYAKLEGVVNDFKTETSGKGNSGNLQPYITLNYIIRAISTTMLTGDVIDSLEGDSSYNAPSIHAVNTKIKELKAYSSTAINEGSEITLDPNPNPNYNPIDIQIDGKSEQETTSGKNLFNIYSNHQKGSTDTSQASGVQVKYNEDGSITLNGTATKNNDIVLDNSFKIKYENGKDYYMLIEYLGGSRTLGENALFDVAYVSYDGTNHYININVPISGNVVTKLKTYTNQQYFSEIRLFQKNSGNVYNNFRIRISVMNDSNQSYEPYTGGQPSPSPDYPQEIKSVSGVENLCLNSRVEDTQTISGITFTRRKDGSVVANGTSTSSLKYYFQPDGEITKVLKAGNYIGSTSMINAPTSGTVAAYIRNGKNGDYKLFGGKTVRQTIQLDTDFTYTCSYIYFSSGVTLDNCIMYPSINKGNTLLPYVPYGHWLEIKDNGYNLCNSDYIRNNYSRSGLTVSKINDDVKVSGTNTSSSAVGMPLFISGNYISLRAGVKYSAKYITGKSASSTTYRMDIRPNNSLGTILAYESGINGLTYTPTSDIDIVLCVRIPGNGTVDLTGKIILCEGDLKEYEPYKEQSTLIDMNKPNLFDKDNANILNGYIYKTDKTLTIGSTNKDRVFYIPCKPSTTYTITRDVIASSFRAASYDNEVPEMTSTNVNYTCSSQIADNTSKKLVITTGTNAKYLFVHYGNISSDTNIQESLDSIKIYEGYEPYYELCSIGDTKDELNIDKNGNVSITQNIGEVVLNGSESWASSGSYGYLLQVAANVFPNRKISIYDGYTSHFRVEKSPHAWTGLYYCGWNNTGVFWVNEEKTLGNNLTSWKTWLSTHPVTVKYILDKPQTISLGKITPLKLLEGTNNITTNDELQPNMKIEYYTDVMGNPGVIPDYDGLPVGSEIDFDGTEIPDGFVQVDDPSTYSSEEVVIGTWFGKPLYRKTYHFDTVPSSNVDIGILPTNIKDISGRFLNDGYFNTINQYTTDQNYRFNIDVSPTGIMRIQKGTSVRATDVYIDIEYTKTTD